MFYFFVIFCAFSCFSGGENKILKKIAGIMRYCTGMCLELLSLIKKGRFFLSVQILGRPDRKFKKRVGKADPAPSPPPPPPPPKRRPVYSEDSPGTAAKHGALLG